MNNILITGGAGFIGFNLLKKILRNTNYNLIVIDDLSSRSSQYNITKINQLVKKNPKRIKFLKLNIGKSFLKEILKLTKELALIIHLAADLNQIVAFKNPKKMFQSNVIGTFNVLNISREFSAPLIFSSSMKVYSDWLNNLKIIEKDKKYAYSKIKGINEKVILDKNFHSRGIYGLTKYIGELMCQEYYNFYNISMIINRKSGIYGPHQYGTVGYGWLWNFTESIIKGKTINVYGNGKQVRDVLYIDDLVDLYLKQINYLIHNSFKIFEIYNIGGGIRNSLSLIEAINYIEKISGRKARLKFLPPRPSDLKIWITDIKYVSNKFKWYPRINVRKGIKLMYNYIKKVI